MEWKIFITSQASDVLLDGRVTRQNDERRSRSQEPLNPDLPETREEWNAAQVAIHEKTIPIQ